MSRRGIFVALTSLSFLIASMSAAAPQKKNDSSKEEAKKQQEKAPRQINKDGVDAEAWYH